MYVGIGRNTESFVGMLAPDELRAVSERSLLARSGVAAAHAAFREKMGEIRNKAAALRTKGARNSQAEANERAYQRAGDRVIESLRALSRLVGRRDA